MLHEIWIEGYAATGNSGGAQLVAIVEANSFKEACIKRCSAIDFEADWGPFDPINLSAWGCRLFPDEQSARKNFG